MAPGCFVIAVAAVLAAAEPATEPAKASVLVATAVEPLRVDKLADALRSYLDDSSVEIRSAPAVSSGDLRADVAATVQAVAGERSAAVLRIALTPADTVEIALSHLPSAQTVLTTIPRARDEDLYRTLALKVQGLLRTLEEPPSPHPDVAVPPPPPPSRVDLEAGPTVRTFPLGDVTWPGILLRGRWAVTPSLRLGLGLRLLPGVDRKVAESEVRMRGFPFILTAERLWRSERWEAAAGLVVLAEARYAQASAGPESRKDWDFLSGAGVSLALGLRLSPILRLTLHAAAIGLPWSSRYRVGNTTVFDATRFEVPLDLTLDLAL